MIRDVQYKARLAFLCLALALTGCAQRGAGTTIRDTAGDASSREATARWAPLVKQWKADLLAAARKDDTKFPTPTAQTFLKRLQTAASEYDFRIVSVDFIPAPQGAPLVIVESSTPSRFAEDTPAIARALDPKAPGGDDWQGWDYEGYFLGAQDRGAEPFLAVYNFMRDHGGGQWARSQDLYAFPHG
jgi:hypothetical protein